jgi:hypothetical protein
MNPSLGGKGSPQVYLYFILDRFALGIADARTYVVESCSSCAMIDVDPTISQHIWCGKGDYTFGRSASRLNNKYSACYLSKFWFNVANPTLHVRDF